MSLLIGGGREKRAEFRSTTLVNEPVSACVLLHEKFHFGKANIRSEKRRKEIEGTTKKMLCTRIEKSMTRNEQEIDDKMTWERNFFLSTFRRHLANRKVSFIAHSSLTTWLKSFPMKNTSKLPFDARFPSIHSRIQRKSLTRAERAFMQASLKFH